MIFKTIFFLQVDSFSRCLRSVSSALQYFTAPYVSPHKHIGRRHLAMVFMMLCLPLAFDFTCLRPLIFSTYIATTYPILGFNRKSVNIFFVSFVFFLFSSADNFRWIFSWSFRWRFIGFWVGPKWITLFESYWRFAGMSRGLYAGDISNHSLILMPLFFSTLFRFLFFSFILFYFLFSFFLYHSFSL